MRAEDEGLNLVYVQQFFAAAQAPFILSKNLFPNLKELTESYGMLNTLLYEAKRLDIDRGVREALVVVVGDGHTPRTGALIALNTAWDVMSVDPELNPDKDWGIARLQVCNRKIQDTPIYSRGYRQLFVIMPHSHALIEEALSVTNHPNTVLINMPCCIKDSCRWALVRAFTDRCIISPKNEIFIYQK